MDRACNSNFHFQKLVINGIDNTSVLAMNFPDMAQEEVCLFSRQVSSGDQYLDMLEKAVRSSLTEKRKFAAVRFADGEYAFYDHNLNCNGLYCQAESVKAIRLAVPSHVEALGKLAKFGLFAPLIFPGNFKRERKGLFSFMLRKGTNDSASRFLEFLGRHGISLDEHNYIPFYIIYAYLTSGSFAELVDGERICIVNSEYNEECFRKWFKQFSSQPVISFVHIPEAYMATRWNLVKKKVLDGIPSGTRLCLVGAGVGALLACVDIAEHLAIAAIDAGHVLNMMNGREDKSKGPRLYTLRK